MHKFFKKYILIFFLCLSIHLTAQTFLNVSYTNTSKKTTSISSISKITFNGYNINYQLATSEILTDAISTISKITFGTSNGGNPLPVELISFNGIIEKESVELFWITATEINNYGFNIERKSKGESWKTIGFKNGFGNSNSVKNYNFKDVSNASDTVKYRLKQIDFDGHYKYSKVIDIYLSVPTKFTLKQNFPNPFNPNTVISYQLPRDAFVKISVYDVLGKEIASLMNENQKAGHHELIFNSSRLASGIYICKMNSESFNSYIKMLIVK